MTEKDRPETPISKEEQRLRHALVECAQTAESIRSYVSEVLWGDRRGEAIPTEIETSGRPASGTPGHCTTGPSDGSTNHEPARGPEEAGTSSGVQVDATAWRWAAQRTREQQDLRSAESVGDLNRARCLLRSLGHDDAGPSFEGDAHAVAAQFAPVRDFAEATPCGFVNGLGEHCRDPQGHKGRHRTAPTYRAGEAQAPKTCDTCGLTADGCLCAWNDRYGVPKNERGPNESKACADCLPDAACVYHLAVERGLAIPISDLVKILVDIDAWLATDGQVVRAHLVSVSERLHRLQDRRERATDANGDPITADDWRGLEERVESADQSKTEAWNKFRAYKAETRAELVALRKVSEALHRAQYRLERGDDPSSVAREIASEREQAGHSSCAPRKEET